MDVIAITIFKGVNIEWIYHFKNTNYLVLDTSNMNTTLNITNPIKVSNINGKLKHLISSMVICESYMHKFSVGKIMKKH